jgi:hypothetical protein
VAEKKKKKMKDKTMKTFINYETISLTKLICWQMIIKAGNMVNNSRVLYTYAA